MKEEKVKFIEWSKIANSSKYQEFSYDQKIQVIDNWKQLVDETFPESLGEADKYAEELKSELRQLTPLHLRGEKGWEDKMELLAIGKELDTVWALAGDPLLMFNVHHIESDEQKVAKAKETLQAILSKKRLGRDEPISKKEAQVLVDDYRIYSWEKYGLRDKVVAVDSTGMIHFDKSAAFKDTHKTFLAIESLKNVSPLEKLSARTRIREMIAHKNAENRKAEVKYQERLKNEPVFRMTEQVKSYYDDNTEAVNQVIMWVFAVILLLIFRKLVMSCFKKTIRLCKILLRCLKGFRTKLCYTSLVALALIIMLFPNHTGIMKPHKQANQYFKAGRHFIYGTLSEDKLRESAERNLPEINTYRSRCTSIVNYKLMLVELGVLSVIGIFGTLLARRTTDVKERFTKDS